MITSILIVFLLLIVRLFAAEILEQPSQLVAAPESLEFLKRFGYLQKSGSGAAESLYSRESVENALKLAQKFGRIPQTGKLDDTTMKLFKSKRCGVVDVFRNDSYKHNHRKRRYILASEGWKKRHLTYFLANWSPKLRRYEVVKELQKALDAWGKYSGLVFTQTKTPGESDITIGFYRGHHGDSYPFDGSGNVLAHAYFPSSWGKLGGDVHFDDDEEWEIGIKNSVDGVDFGVVALHELGHSLGLSHSSEPDSVMNPYYKSDGSLGHDDIMAMHDLYSFETDRNEYDWKRRYYGYYTPYTTTKPWPSTSRSTTMTFTSVSPTIYSRIPSSTRFYRSTTAQYQTDDDIEFVPAYDEPKTQSPKPPRDFGCQGSYTAVAYIRGELYIIKDQMLWRLYAPGELMNGYPVPIHTFFHKLPKSVKKIDTMFQREFDQSIVIFSDKNYWIFDGYEFIEGTPRPITDYGLPESINQVDAAMVWKDSNTYVFSGNHYWKYNETTRTPYPDYPKLISNFAQVPDNLDSVLMYNKAAYFFKGNNYWVLNNELNNVETGPTSASEFLLSC